MAGGWFLCLSWGLNTILLALAGPQLSPPSCVALGKSLHAVPRFPHLCAGFTTVPTSVCGDSTGFAKRGACHVRTTSASKEREVLRPAEARGRRPSALPRGTPAAQRAAPPGLPEPEQLPLPPAASCPALLTLLPPEETARPPADVPFFLLPLSHTRHMAPASGPTGPTQQLLPPSLAWRGGAGQRLPCRTAVSTRGPTGQSPRATPAAGRGVRKHPRAVCTPGGRVLLGGPLAQGRARGPKARGAPCNEPGPPGCLPRWTMCSEDGDGWPGFWTPREWTPPGRGARGPSTHPVSTHRICRLLHRPPPHRWALQPSSFYR